jgi:hypothetical protein
MEGKKYMRKNSGGDNLGRWGQTKMSSYKIHMVKISMKDVVIYNTQKCVKICNGIYNYITENACDEIWKLRNCSRMRDGYKTYLLFACVFPSFPNLENKVGL